MADCHVENSGWALEDIGEETSVDVRLLVVQIQLAAVGLLRREIIGQDLGFEAFREVVF